MERYRLRRDKDAASLEGGKGSPGLRSRTGKLGGNPTRSGDRLAVAAAAATTTTNPGPDRPTTLPRRGRSTDLAGFARSSTSAPARLRRAYAIPRAPHLSRAVLRPRCARARPAPVAPWSAMSNVLDAATRFPSSPLRGSPIPDADARLRLFPRATVIGDADAHPTRYENPRLSRRLRRGRAAVAPSAHAERREDAACSFTCPLPPSPAAPTKTTPAKLSWSLLHAPALSRLLCGTRTASTLDAGLCAGSAAKRLPWCRAPRDFFESSAGSPQALSAAAFTARRAVQLPAFRLRASVFARRASP